MVSSNMSVVQSSTKDYETTSIFGCSTIFSVIEDNQSWPPLSPISMLFKNDSQIHFSDNGCATTLNNIDTGSGP